MKTTLVLKDEVVRRAKKRAAEMGLTLSAFAERSIRDALAPRSQPRKAFHFPTFGAAGNKQKRDTSPAEIKELLSDDLT